MPFASPTTIRSRLLQILMIAVGSVVTILVGAWHFIVMPALQAGVARHQQQIALRAADQIEQFVENKIRSLTAVTQIGDFWDANREHQKVALYQLLKFDPHIHEVSIIGLTGQEILRLSRSRVYTDADLSSLAQQEKFQRAIKGESYMSPVYHTNAFEPFVTVAVPVKLTVKNITGVILAEITLKSLWDSISDIKVGKSGYAFVVDREGNLIAHPDSSKVLRGINLSLVQEVREFLNEARDSDFGEQSIGESGQKVLGTFAAVKGLNWAVVVEEPVETALAEIRSVRRVGISLLVVVTGATFLIGYFFSGRLTQPIRELEQGAKLIAQGNLGQKLEIRTGDEIENLAHQFNRMAQALKQSYQSLEEKIAERTRDLSALYTALAPFASSDADQVLQKVVERLKEATHADAALIRIFDKETKTFLYPAHVGFASTYLEATRDPEQGSAIGMAFTTGEPIIAADIAEDPRLKSKRQLEAGFRSCAFLPLRVSGELRGIVHLASREIGHFSENKTDHLMAIARQMGVAMENRELYEDATKTSQEQQVLREFLSKLLLLDLDELLHKMTEQAALLFKAEYARVRLFDEHDRIKTRAVAGDKEVVEIMSIAGEREELVGRGRRMLNSRKPLAIKDMAQEVGGRPSRGVKAGLHGFLGAPLLGRDQKPLGVIQIMTRSPRDFSQQDLDLIEQFAHGAAIAMENARLFGDAERRAKEQEALNVIVTATSQSLHLDELLQIALERVLEVTGREQGYIRLKDPVTGKLRLAAHRGISKEYIEVLLHRRTPGGKGDRVLESGEVLVINDPEGVPLKEETRREGRHSLIWVPLKAREKVVGLLNVTTNRPIPFAPREVELLQAIGNVIGVALENARLFQETERRNRELQSLYTVTSTVTQSLDIDTLMQTALETTINVLGVDAGRLYVFDGKINALRLAAHWGISEDQLRGIGHYAPGEGVIGRIFVENRPFFFSDVETDLNYQAMARGQLAHRGGYRSVAGLPITVKDSPVGVIYVYGRLPRNFTQEEMGLFSTIGGQIGVALENARLFEESQKNLRRIRALREIDQAISSTLDFRNVLDVLMEKIDLVLPYSAATVRLFNKDSGLLEPIACRNLDEEEWKVSIWRGGRGIANVVFETRAPLIILNAQTDSRVRDVDFYRKHKLISYVGIPLIVKDEILGVLGFYTKQEHEFNSEEVEFLSALGGQAAIAIHNSQLYEEARKREAQLQETNDMLSALHSVAAAASQSLNLDRILHAAVEKITEIFHFDATRIHIYNEPTDELLLKVWFETDPDRFTSARSFKRGEGIVGKVAQSGEPMIFEDIQNDPLYEQVSRIKLLPQFGYHFLAVFPIKGRLKNLGTLTFIGTNPRKLSSGEVQLLEAMADQIAVAIENSGLYEDVKEKVQELEQKTAELERANRVKDEFLSVMSHELRTPLNVVMGYTGMVKDGMLGDTNPEQQKALEKVMGRTKDLLSMITSILYATSIEAHEVRVEPHRFALGDFLDGLRRDFDISPDKPLTLVWNYPSDLPTVETDSEKLKCVLQNLIHNALKFSESGHVTISARIQGSVEPRAISDHQLENSGKEKLVEFKVTDTGMGIPTEKLPIIFGMFRQVDSSETRLHGGVGLGLYIAKNFTELLGGKIEVETEVGKGSIFTVTIPVASREGANGQLTQEKRREFTGYSLTASGLPPERG
jgi:GAF domain-containing protein